jgi:hypothetical protein
MYNLIIDPKDFGSTREELQRYSADISTATSKEIHFPSFKKILRIKTRNPQKIFDCFYALGQFVQYKSAQKPQ